ncbi:vacuolar fusion protein MON1 homolog A-like [Mizuhopecten yessoensis]|uniref:Vacuolar fusion protein MON1 homolog n=1 Tax=Mizuhopecten yessoensis TaxID=6573 RepID=A0A210PFP2_MIZYE|nr:vacuolar fusion protein MON1 homolog A-like [Mizuhopecten yessoensis]OWF35302.1 Vacuolar fusion protein MON1-like A [Mizuhopecten yessoensis]
MAERKKEADHLPTSESDQDDFIEPDPPVVTNQAVADTFVNIDYEDLVNPDYDSHPSGYIHEIVRQGSHDDDDEPRVAVSSVSDVSTGEESSEDHTEISTKEISQALDEVSKLQHPEVSLEDEEEIDEVDTQEWRQRKKHVFILSQAGKPVYTRFGNEDKLVTVMGVMSALVSFVQDSKDLVRFMVAGDHKFVFLVREHLILVCVSHGAESSQQILLHLSYVYNQILSVLTFSTLHRIFKQRRNYDLRRLLTGAEKFLDNLLNMMDTEPGMLLGAVRCLPLDSQVRDNIAQTIVQNAKVKDLVFALILANNQLVTLVRMKKYFLHPMDLHLIINLVNASESFKAAESWTPICLPKFDSSGFLQAHISYLDDRCETCLLLLSVDRESFFILSECRNKIKERLVKYNALKAISDSLMKTSYSIQQCGISDLRHFLYKSRHMAQFTSPELEAPYLSETEQERLCGLYFYLHHRIHTSARPLKILYTVGPHETLLGWVTQSFELYAVFGPLVTKVAAIQAINKLLRWVKREEDRLFIPNHVTF